MSREITAMTCDVTTSFGIAVLPLFLLALPVLVAVLFSAGWLAAKRRWRAMSGLLTLPLVLLFGLVTIRFQWSPRPHAATQEAGRQESSDFRRMVQETQEESARLESQIRSDIERLEREIRREAGRMIGDEGFEAPLAPPPGDVPSLPAASESWRPEDELGFEADLYPSLESAARSLARSAARAMEQGADSPGRGFLPGWEKALEQKILGCVAGLKTAGDGASVTVIFTVVPPALSATRPDATPGNAAVSVPVTLTLRARSAARPPIGAPADSEGVWSGTLRIQLAEGRLLDHTAAFDSKPWLTDPAAVSSRRPGWRWIVGLSQDGRTSPHEAESAAMEAAAVRLACEVRPRLSFAASRLLSDAELVRHVAWLAPRNGLVLDRFVQGFKRPYGEFWRCAVLVDASPEAVERLAHGVGLGFQATRDSWLRVLASYGGLIALIGAAYLLLNAATRGYYVWSIRVLCGLGLLAGIAVVLSLAA